MIIKCPFCHFENEDGALFCEQCKSDLSGVEPSGSPSIPMIAEAIPVEEEPMMAEPIMAEPIMAEPIMAEVVPLEAEPVVPLPLEPIPLAAEPVEYGTPVVPLMEIAPKPAPPPAPPPPVAAAPMAPPRAPAPAPAPAPAAPAAAGIPAGANPRLKVLRGQKRDLEYPICEGQNYIGRSDEMPVDIDLEGQEPEDRVFCSRQHAVIHYEGSSLQIEDLNSANGTFVNRVKINPGQPKDLAPGDLIQIGAIQMKLLI